MLQSLLSAKSNRLRARCTLAWMSIVLVSGMVVSIGKGVWPRYQGPSPDAPAKSETATDSDPGLLVTDSTSPDLQLYRAIVNSMRGGDNYYSAAGKRLKQYGFAMASTFNWRLPTAAWCMSWFERPRLLQFSLIGLAAVAMAMLLIAIQRDCGWPAAIGAIFMEVGVLRHSLDWATFYAHEMWAAVFILISIAAMGLRWHRTAVAAGLFALFLRELSLPVCVVGAAFAWRNGRKREAFTWCGGIVIFFAYLAWHAMQVAQHSVQQASLQEGSGIGQWLQFGGLNFVLSTVRMNTILLDASGAVLFAYLFLALLGLAVPGNEWRQRVLATCGLYLAAFLVVGQPFNFYWGLLFGPLLPIGLFRAPDVLSRLIHAATSPQHVEPVGVARG